VRRTAGNLYQSPNGPSFEECGVSKVRAVFVRATETSRPRMDISREVDMMIIYHVLFEVVFALETVQTSILST